MRLVGATNFFIQKPYLINSVYQGFFSSVLNLYVDCSLEVLRKQIPDFIQTNEFWEIGIIFGLLLIFGIIISWVSTFFAVKRYLSLNENKLYN